MDIGLGSITQQARELQTILSSAFNQDTGKLDLLTFSNSLEKSGKTLQDYGQTLSSLGPTGQEAFGQVVRAISMADAPLVRTNKLFDQLWITMKNTMRWQITSSALNSFIGSLETAYGYAQDLNESLTNIRIVTENSAEWMADFAKQANEAAKALSTTTTDYTDAALIYYQQGLSEQEVIDRTETTIKMANAAGVSAQTASDQLTAVWNNFYDGSKSLEYYADVMVRLGADTASSTDEISEGIQQFASVADTVGLSYEYAASALATVTATTRESANIVGTAFRTLFARIQGLNLGETLDDGTTLNKYSQALEKVGISIYDVNGEIRSMDSLLDEMGAKWETLSNDQQIALAQTVAGVRQYTRLIALMDNWDFFQENLASAYGAEGSLQEQADIYAESWEAARDRVRASAEDIYDSVINDDFFIGVDNALSPFLSGVADVIDGMGGLNGILLTTATLITSVYGDKIAQGMRDMATNISIITGVEAKRAEILRTNAISTLQNLESTYAAGDAEAYRLNIIYREAEVQQLYNQNYNSMTKQQRASIQLEQQALNILRDENLVIADSIQKLQKQTTEGYNSIFINIPQGKDGWQQQLQDQINNWNSKVGKNYRINLQIGADTTVEKVFSDISKQLDQLTKKHASLRLITNQFQNLDSSSERYEQNLRELIATYTNLDTSSKTVQQMESYLRGLGTRAENTESQIRELGNVLISLGANNTNITKYIEALIQLELQLKRGEITQEQYNAAVANLKTSIETASNATKDWAARIVSVGNGISSLLMAVNGLKSIGRVFSDEDMTSGERLITILTGLSMIIPSLTTVVGLLNKEKAAGVVIDGLSVTVTKSGMVADLAKAAVNKILAVSEGQVATATQVSNAAMAARLIMMAPYIIAIAAVAAGIYGLVKLYNADADAAKAAAEESEKLTKVHENLQNSYEELTSTIADYQEAVEGLQELTKGTQEYEDALNSANEAAEELVKNNSELQSQARRNSEGLIVFNDLEGYQQQQERITANSAIADYVGQQRANNAQIKADTTEVRRSITYTTDTGASATINSTQLNQVLQVIQKTGGLIASDLDQFTNMTDGLKSSIMSHSDDLIKLANSMDQLTAANNFLAQEIVRNYAGANNSNYQELDAAEQSAVDAAIAGIDTEQIKQDALDYYNSLTDEEVHKEYAEQQGLIYDHNGNWFGNAGRGFFIDSEGNDVDFDDKYIRDYLAQQKVLEEIAGEESDVADMAIEAVTKLQEIGDEFGEGLGNELLGFIQQQDTAFDNIGELSPEQVQNILSNLESSLSGISEEEWATLGYENAEDYANAVARALNDYDPIGYYLGQASKSQANADDIGELLSAYQNEQELDEDQLAYVDELIAKYDYLGELRLTNTHDYLEALRDIQEQEESAATSSLESAAEEQRKQIQELEEEIANLQNFQDGGGFLNSVLTDNPIFEGILQRKIEELQEKLEELTSTEYKIQVSIDEDLASDVDQAFGLANEIDQLRGYLEDGLEITYDRAQEIIAAGYGAMLTNAQETANSTILLNKQVVNDFIDGKQTEIEVDRQARIKQLETERAALEAKRNSIDQGIAALQAGLKSQDAATKASALATAAAYKAEADSKEVAAEKEADAADQSNLEISEDAAKLVDALGLMHETNAENAQQAYDDAEEAANQSAASQINALNQIQLAAVRMSEAIANAPDGSAVYNPVSFQGTNNVEVGATGSQSGENTYSITEADIDTLTDDILEAANNNTDILDEAIQQGLEQLELERNQINAQIGAIDAGIAALKSADLSLDKTQRELGTETSGGDNEGTVYDPEAEKTLEDIEDRYHEINREIEDQNSLLEDVGNNIERAYGNRRLQAYEKELQELNKQQENYNKKLAEAETYLDFDRTNLQSLFGNSLTFDENGEIQGYQQVLQSMIDDYNNNFLADYNAFLAEFSALTKAEQEARQAEYDSWQQQKTVADELFQKRQDALAQYEDTLDTIQEIRDSQEEIARNIVDNRLSQIEYKLEVVLDVKEAKDAVLELTRDIAESFGDMLTHGIQSTNIGWEEALGNMNVIDDYYDALNSYQNELANATDATDIARIMDNLADLQSQAISTADALLEWVESLETLLPDALDDASERFAQFTDQLEHNESVLGLIEELYALQGVTYKTQEGFDQLQKVGQETMEAQVAQAQLHRSWYENSRQELLEAQAALDALGGDETDPAYDGLKANRDALLEEFNEAQEAMLSSAQAAMETAQEMYTQAIERAVYEFGQTVSGGVGLDLLQDKFDHYIDQEGRYLDTVNEAYEVASWYNKLQEDIDKTTNSKLRDQLKNLQEEIDLRRENNTLSEYDLEILEAKYNVLQAQIALEDAQNAKNELRLVRDRQGNWNYQYTADPSQIADAEQNLLDAENEWYNIAKQQVEDVTGEIISTWQECQSAIEEIYNDMSLTDEERAARAEEIYAYYTQKIKDLENEKQVAIADMTEAGNKSLFDMAVVAGDEVSDLTGITSQEIQDIIANSGMSIIELLMADNEQIKDIVGSNTQLIDLFDNVFAKDLANMTANAGNFEDYLSQAMSEAEGAMTQYQDTVSSVADETGTNLDDLSGYIDDVSTSTDICRDAGLEATEMMWDQIDAIQDLSQYYLDLADSVYEYIEALRDLARETAQTMENEANRTDDLPSATVPDRTDTDDSSNTGGNGSEGGGNQGSGGGTISHSDMVQLVYDIGRGVYDNNPVRRKQVEAKYPGAYSQAQSILNRAIAQDEYNYRHNGTAWRKTIEKLVSAAGFDTGGYTGEFDNAKLAFLHEKELVLNQEDTKNILSAVSAMRALGPEFIASIESALDNNALSAKGLMASRLGNNTQVAPANDTIEQRVTIEHVEFPNVTSSDEIQDALRSLVDDAAQWANRRKG